MTQLRHRVFTILVALMLVSALIPLAASPGVSLANPSSAKVGIIGSPGVINGGTLPTSISGSSIIFDNLAPGSVNLTNLANYDTVVLNVASSEMDCNVNILSTQAKADLVSFVGNGGKLIIYDSECSPQDYSWLPYPFTTSNPGAMGAHGTLNIVEDNTLSSKDSASPYYIDAANLSNNTDAVGDMNVMTTFNPNWCVDMSGTNYNHVTGPVHTYARYGTPGKVGLIIYNGLDMDYMGTGYYNNAWLTKIYNQEIQQSFNPDNLPCQVAVVGITLAPSTGSAPVGQNHTVTATLTDLLGNNAAGIFVTFNVLSGPNSPKTGTGTTDASGQASFTYTGSGGKGIDTIVASFVNDQGVTVSSSQVQMEWTNQPPTVQVDQSTYNVNEGSSVTVSATGSDPDGDTLTYAWDLNNDGIFETAGQTATFSAVDGPSSNAIQVQVTDPGGLTATAPATVEVQNVKPTVQITGPATGTVYAVNTPVPFTGTFTDPGKLDTHTAQWTFDGSNIPGTVTEANGDGTVTDNHSFSEAGVYNVTLTVTDKDGGVGSASQDAMIVVYDPSAGFVTGGGWINSPAGAYAADPTMTGRANFGFVSKYQKGATVPTGETEFQFKAGNLNFHSTSYDWLVVAGAKAQYKGTGTINNAGSYKFILTAIDGQVNAKDGVDMFRIKIIDPTTDKVIYDNQMGADNSTDPTTALSGGSIVIHK